MVFSSFSLPLLNVSDLCHSLAIATRSSSANNIATESSKTRLKNLLTSCEGATDSTETEQRIIKGNQVHGRLMRSMIQFLVATHVG